MRTLLALIVLVMLQPAQANDLYRWVDKHGKVHYGDVPPDEDAEQLNLKRYGSPRPASGVQDASLPYETRRAREHFPVTLYVTPECGSVCKEARALLTTRRIPYTENMLKTPEDVDAFAKKFGRESIPTLTVGSSTLKGFQAEQWNSELDAAGYPKGSGAK